MFGPRPISAIAPASDPSIRVLALNPSVESCADALAKRHPQYVYVKGSSDVAAVESQQLDASHRKAEVEEVLTTLDTFDKEHPHTGPMNVYLLDGAGVAGTDEQNEGPLRAVVAQVLANPSHTVAALMPESSSVKTIDDLSPASMLRALADSVLSTEGVTLLVGKEALESYMDDVASGKIKPIGSLQPSNEGILYAGITMAAIAVLMMKAVKDTKKAEAAKTAFEKMKNNVEEHFGNQEWLNNQSFIDGKIQIDNIAGALSVNHIVPSNIPDAAAHTNQKLRTYLYAYKNYVEKYCGHLGDYRREFATVVDSNKLTEEAARRAIDSLYGKLNALKLPAVAVHFPDKELLGSLTLNVSDPSHPKLNMQNKVAGSTTVNALTKDDVSRLAKPLEELIECLDIVDITQSNIDDILADDHSLGDLEFGHLDELMAKIDRKDDVWTKWRACNARYRWEDTANDKGEHLSDLGVFLIKVIGALGSLVERSIK